MAAQVPSSTMSHGSSRVLTLAPIDPAADRGAWSRLALATPNVFATPEWVEAWWRHFGSRFDPLLLGARRADGTLAAVLPFAARRRAGVSALRFAGFGPADELGPACAPEDRQAVADAVRAAQRSGVLRRSVILAEDLSRPAGWRRMLHGRMVRTERSPVITGPDCDVSALLSSRERRLERRLARVHGLQYRLTADPSEVAADMDALARLHHLRWSPEESSALAGARLDFHRDFARAAHERGWLRLWTMILDDKPAAAWYGFRYGDAVLFYQSGRDPTWERRSIGSLLLVHTIRSAFEEGAGAYHLLRGGEAYKSRFATDDPGLETVVVGAGAAAAVAAAAGRIAAASPPHVRARIRDFCGG